MEADRILNEELIKQYIMAGSTRTRSEKLRVLAEHFCDKIRMRVAENPSTPPDVLRNLAHDPSNDVRIAVATNKSCEDAVIKRLARDNDVIVRHGLAQNVDLPRAILEELADDENGWVRGEALKTLEIIDSRSGDEVGRQRNLKRTRDRRMVANFEKRVRSDKDVAS